MPTAGKIKRRNGKLLIEGGKVARCENCCETEPCLCHCTTCQWCASTPANFTVVISDIVFCCDPMDYSGLGLRDAKYDDPDDKLAGPILLGRPAGSTCAWQSAAFPLTRYIYAYENGCVDVSATQTVNAYITLGRTEDYWRVTLHAETHVASGSYNQIAIGLIQGLTGNSTCNGELPFTNYFTCLDYGYSEGGSITVSPDVPSVVYGRVGLAGANGTFHPHATTTLADAGWYWWNPYTGLYFNGANPEAAKFYVTGVYCFGVTDATQVTELWFEGAQSVNLVDITKLTSLTYFMINSATGLTTIDLTKNIVLTDVTIDGCGITTINFTQCVLLQNLSFQNDTANVASVDLSNCPELVTVNAGSSNLNLLFGSHPDLTTAYVNDNQWRDENGGWTCDLSRAPNLATFNCVDSFMMLLDISGTKVVDLNLTGCSIYQVNAIGCTLLETIDMSAIHAEGWIGALDCHNSPLITSLDFTLVPNWPELGIDSIVCHTCIALTEILFPADGESEPDIDCHDCTALTALDMNGQNFYTLDCSGCTSMATLDLTGCWGNAVNIANCTAMSAAAINSILAALRAEEIPAGTLNMTNCTSPTGQGIVDLAYLKNTLGWEVIP